MHTELVNKPLQFFKELIKKKQCPTLPSIAEESLDEVCDCKENVRWRSCSVDHFNRDATRTGPDCREGDRNRSNSYPIGGSTQSVGQSVSGTPTNSYPVQLLPNTGTTTEIPTTEGDCRDVQDCKPDKSDALPSTESYNGSHSRCCHSESVYNGATTLEPPSRRFGFIGDWCTRVNVVLLSCRFMPQVDRSPTPQVSQLPPECGDVLRIPCYELPPPGIASGESD